MAISRSAYQITWPSGNVVVGVAVSGDATSDSRIIHSTSIDGRIIVKVQNSGTPIDGDKITCKLLMSLGDTDANPNINSEYETAGSVAAKAIIDTYIVNPALVSFKVPVAAEYFKLYVNSVSASVSVVSAQYVEKKAS